jgi:molecular chaperone GrpE (heat shock protein)
MSEARKAKPATAGFHLPFLIGDGVLLATATVLFAQGHRPLQGYEVAAIGFCVALGAWLGVWPWVLRHRAALKRMETDELKDTVARIQQLDEVARRVEIATNKWQTAQDAADRTARAARDMAAEMAEREGKFQEFLTRANDTERRHLRLEVQKLRQGENTWLQVLVFIMDHIHALHTAADRSGQRKVAREIGRFQHACLDAARRVGLARLEVPPGAPFDAEQHHLPEPEAAAARAGAPVVALLAPGYSFQGRLLRKPLVTLKPLPEPEPAPDPDAPSPAHQAFSASTGPAPAPETEAEKAAEPAPAEETTPAATPGAETPPAAEPRPSPPSPDPASTAEEAAPEGGSPGEFPHGGPVNSAPEKPGPHPPPSSPF